MSDGAIGDATAGAKLFARSCATCHTVKKGGPHKQGPNLYGVMGRETGKAPGFNYSEANKKKGITWTPETMDQFLINPKAYIPGTKMIFAGIKDDQKRKTIFYKNIGILTLILSNVGVSLLVEETLDFDKSPFCTTSPFYMNEIKNQSSGSSNEGVFEDMAVLEPNHGKIKAE